ncbi:SDR family NAD(P)-dependent oxidoreductase [Bacillus pumilus]|uniref:SDR family NAD(P)-dependent oxidoreductase n=1 Tax=Bacillus pumilus TaxID=1408 RepID=UPI0011A733AA|nr:SDR family NAD(P)-dependent oxidoreductase [Bacillus pumilus]
MGDIEKNGGEGVKMKGDVWKEEDMRGMIDKGVDRFGSVDVMMNKGGIENEVGCREMRVDNWKKVMSRNLRGMFVGWCDGVKYMRDDGIEG